MNENLNSNTPGNSDQGGFLWGLLGCCIPVAGLVLFLVWKDQKPKTARAAGIGALVSLILNTLLCFLYIIFLFFGVFLVSALLETAATGF